MTDIREQDCEKDGGKVPRAESAKAEPRWRTIERTVAVLEQMLQPDAKVFHNIWLTETVTGTHRQCDVVIRSGTPPRDTLTIVEVQDRARRVELADYDAWCQKREKLQAQHLICVAATGFPDSVQRDAAKRGGTVRLMTLLDTGVFPPFFEARETDFELVVIEKYDMDFVFDSVIPQGVGEHRLDEKILRVSGVNEPVSAMQVAEAERGGTRARSMRTTATNADRFDCFYELDLTQPGPRISVVASGGLYPLAGLNVVEHCSRHHYRVKLEPLAYEQIGFGESLGWVFWGLGRHEGEVFQLRLPFTRSADGGLRLGPMEVTPTKGHTVIGGGVTVVYKTA
jgi:hypothetical protein